MVGAVCPRDDGGGIKGSRNRDGYDLACESHAGEGYNGHPRDWRLMT